MSRFENRTFANLQSEMLDQYKNDMKTDVQEGSLVSVSIAKQAVRLEDAYRNLDYINDNMLPDTMDREHLISWGASLGMPVSEGKYALVKAEFNVEIETGTEYTASEADYSYIVVEDLGKASDGSFQYSLESLDPGTAPGSYRGEIEPAEDIPDGFESAKITDLIIAGADAEETEDYRDRLSEAFNTRASSGNMAYYIKECDEFDGIAATKVARRTKSSELINVYVLSDGYAIPSAKILKNLKEYLDPEDQSGFGMGVVPIGHRVKVNSAVPVAISVEVKVEYEPDQNYASMKEAMEDAVRKYLTELRSTWEKSSFLAVRVFGIESAIINVKGIVDAEKCTINDSASNKILGEFEVPVFASLKVS